MAPDDNDAAYRYMIKSEPMTVQPITPQGHAATHTAVEVGPSTENTFSVKVAPSTTRRTLSGTFMVPREVAMALVLTTEDLQDADLAAQEMRKPKAHQPFYIRLAKERKIGPKQTHPPRPGFR